MKLLALLTCGFAGILLAGCAYHRSAPTTKAAHPAPTIITPNESLGGKVVAVNVTGRFVVLNFASVQMPRVDQTLFLYRAGLKVAEIKITGPQNDDNTVADIVTGEVHVGDDVRDQ